MFEAGQQKKKKKRGFNNSWSLVRGNRGGLFKF